MYMYGLSLTLSTALISDMRGSDSRSFTVSVCPCIVASCNALPPYYNNGKTLKAGLSL